MATQPDALRIAERLRERYSGPAPSTRDFSDLSTIQQLDAIEIACRSPFYAKAREEAAPESEGYEQFLALATDSLITDNEIGRRFREMLIAGLQRAAMARGESLTEFLP